MQNVSAKLPVHGRELNRKILEKFVDYAKDQGYIPFQPALNVATSPHTGMKEPQSIRLETLEVRK